MKWNQFVEKSDEFVLNNHTSLDLFKNLMDEFLYKDLSRLPLNLRLGI